MPAKPNNSTLGNQIAEFVFRKRTELGIVQGHMANELDMNQSCYSKLEKGYRDFSLSELEIIAGIFEMSLPEFFLKAFAEDGNIIQALQSAIAAMSHATAEKTAQRLRRELMASGGRFASAQMMLELIHHAPSLSNMAI